MVFLNGLHDGGTTRARDLTSDDEVGASLARWHGTSSVIRAIDELGIDAWMLLDTRL